MSDETIRMRRHKALVATAKAALQDVFSDTSVSPFITEGDLINFQLDVELKLTALREDQDNRK